MNAPELSCQHCGTAVHRPPYALRGGQCSCETCYLREKEFREAEDRNDAAYRALAESLAAALDAREHETGLHSKRVACHTLVLARRFSTDAAHLRQVYWGALLHDIGKIGIPDAVLLKAGPLDDAELAKMRTHPEVGFGILKELTFMRDAAQIVLCHEERFDGKGYPRGLAGDAIPLDARLFAVIDTLDAVTSDRPYRLGLPFDHAKAEIQRCAGEQFDPVAVEAFCAEERVLRDMVAAKCGLEMPPLWPAQ